MIERLVFGVVPALFQPPIRPFVRLAVLLFWTLVAAVPLGEVRADGGPGGVIRGRIVDPHRLRPEEAALMLVRDEDNGSISSTPISLAADGSFATPRLRPGTYVLEIVRTPNSAIRPASVVGFRIVTVGSSDVSAVMVEVRRDTAIAGRFRMESDNPTAEWPTHLVVNAVVAVDRQPSLNNTVAEGGPGGRFVLRNAFGPRVLRCGFGLAPGSWWWPSRVLLDGRDVTNVPTDFSKHENGQLEIVFTQHPARISGTVTDAQGQRVPAAWIMVTATDRALWQHWATTSDVAQGDAKGRFSIPAVPGQYRIRAVPQATFPSLSEARRHVLRFTSGGVLVALAEREVKTVELTLSALSQ
jgi:hypothetical protein